MRNLLFAIATLLAPTLAPGATIEMDVNGLVCAFCAQGITKTLRANPATADVVVSLEQKLVAVATRDGKDIPDDDLRRALTDAGYEVRAIRRVPETLDEVRARLKGQR